MKKYKYITGIALAATMLTACSGLDDDDIPVAEQTVPVTFYIRSASPATRVTEDTQEGTEAENAIHTVKVWLYQSAFTDATGDHEPLLLGYKEITGNTAAEPEVTINIPKAVADEGHKLDVYAVANAESVGLSGMNAGTDFATSYLAGSNFVPVSATTSAGVPTTGLPMSQIAMEQTIITSGTGAPYTLNKIDLVRAISKIRFAFVRDADVADVKVTGIEIDGNLIPTSERIFPLQTADNYATASGIAYKGDRFTNIYKTGTDANDYSQTKMVYGTTDTNGNFTNTLLNDDNILEHVWPKWFSIDYAGVTGKAYEQRIDSLLEKSNYDFTTYLRESDKAITGRIWYQFGNEPVKSAPFKMDSPDTGKTAQDFARNHIYTVYAYFKAGKLEVKPSVLKWDWEADNENTYESKGSIEVSILGDKGKQSYKIFNPTPLAGEYPNNINWNNAYVGIYYGVEKAEDDPLRGQPLYTPMIHLSTKYQEPLTLYSSNSDFGFVVVTIDEHGHRTYDPAIPADNSDPTPKDNVVIPAWTPGTPEQPNPAIDTYFFVVPKTKLVDVADANEVIDARITHIYLLDPNNYKQPINPSFMPGPNNIEIWYYYMNKLDAYHDLHDYQ